MTLPPALLFLFPGVAPDVPQDLSVTLTNTAVKELRMFIIFRNLRLSPKISPYKGEILSQVYQRNSTHEVRADETDIINEANPIKICPRHLN